MFEYRVTFKTINLSYPCYGGWKISRGRQRKRWIDNSGEDLEERDVQLSHTIIFGIWKNQE